MAAEASVERAEYHGHCVNQRWDAAKAMIARNPELMWKDFEGSHLITVITITEHGASDMLEFMYERILSLELPKELETQLLCDTFEIADNGGWTAAHVAAGRMYDDCLKLLLAICPSGQNILFTKKHDGLTPLFLVALQHNKEMLEYLMSHSVQGMDLLKHKCRRNTISEVGPFSWCYKERKSEICLKSEVWTIETLKLGEQGSLISVVFQILGDETRKRLQNFK